MKIEEVKEIIKNGWLFNSANEHIELKEAISTLLQELEHLQKENEKLQIEVNSLEKHLKDAQEGWTTLYMKGAFDKNEHWRNKIREKIKEINKLLPDIDYRDIKDKQEREYYKKEYYKVVAERNILQNLLKEE